MLLEFLFLLLLMFLPPLALAPIGLYLIERFNLVERLGFDDGGEYVE